MSVDERLETAASENPLTTEASYQVDGFRSLTGFSINLTRGLNVLVGPNGSGKTNFIEFLDFLSAAITQGASTAVSRVGGVSRVFSTEQAKSSTAKIKARVSGIGDLSPYADTLDACLFGFDYEVEIRFSRDQSVVFIAHELLRFRRLHSAGDQNVPAFPVGSISVRRQASKLDAPPTVKIGPRLLVDAIKNPMRFANKYVIPSSATPDTSDYSFARSIASDESMLSAGRSRPAMDAIRSAIMRGRSFNLIPERARTPDEITRNPTILFDGSGLTATLFHLQRAGKPVRRTLFSRHRFTPEQLEHIVDWTRLVFPALNAINVTADPHTGRYIGFLIVGPDDLRIPLQAASDGTLKWLSLVTLIITRGGVYSIEEPENFLHPRMQQLLVDLVRDYSADPDKPGYFILSTHSETIINQCSPQELILFDFEEGVTRCGRLENAQAVQDQINQTGFGLGYYYASNAVS